MFKDCYAYYDAENQNIILGNSRIEKSIYIKGCFWRTHSVTDKSGGKTWSGGAPRWQRCPIIAEDETPEIFFVTVEPEESYGMLPHLTAELSLTGKNGTGFYRYIIFPDIPFIFTQNYIIKSGEVTTDESSAEELVASGIESLYEKKGGEIFCSLDTLDSIPLGNAHLEVESFKLYDKTDLNDLLVEHQTLPIYKMGRTQQSGNVFCINDYPHGDSLMLVKHAPTESSALSRLGADLIIDKNSSAQLTGTGIDLKNLPEGKVPYYASAVGVGKYDEIYSELARYNNAMNIGDDRGSLFIMSNTWGDRNRDMALSEEFILGEIDRAKSLGVDIIQIDDGWQSGISANSGKSIGGVWEGFYGSCDEFWSPDIKKFPNGLEPIIKKAEENGIEIGLWFAPDSSNDFSNFERDIETIFGLYKKYGVRYFKLDSVKIRNKLCEMRFIRLLEELTERSDGEIRFNLDVTAEDRFGYLYEPRFGTLFVENRYTDWGNYFPHNTFKNLWQLSSILPPRRLQMEVLNPARNPEKYKGLDFAPSLYGIDYLFAIVMPSNPLLWMEMSHLSERDVELLGRIIAIYKKYAAEIFALEVLPIGNCPNGMSFSGYFCQNADKKSGHLLLFREFTERDTYTFALPTNLQNTECRVIYQSAPAEISVADCGIKVKFGAERSFVWAEIK